MNSLTRSLFVRNEEAAADIKEIQNLVCNLLPKVVRNDTMEDRNFLVVPMVILTEGVHNGSDGPLYYPPQELSKTPEVWNHKPVVVYHPEINGVGVSACDPTIISNRKVGLMMNTRFEKGRLKSEAWIERDRANKVDERIMAAIESNEMMEVSTGVFVDCESTEGEWKGETYKGIARNFRPDHLALLPDKIGACSIADGAGFLRNEQGKRNPVSAAIFKVLMKMGLTDNAMSFSSIQDQLRQALWKKLGIDKEGYSGPYCYVVDVYSNFVIYEYDNELYRLGYSATDTGVTLDDEEPVEVNRVTEYRTVGGSYVGNQDQNKTTQNNMDKKKLVDAILLLAATAAAGGVASWTEGDREQLMAFNEEQLKLIQNKVPKVEAKKEEPKTEPKKEEPATNAAAKTEPKKEEPAKVVTMEEFVGAAPPQIREVLNNSLATYNEEKGRLIEAILLVKNTGFTKESLQNRPLGELKSLAALAGLNQPTKQPNYYGGQGNVMTENSDAEEALEVPTLNFAKAGAK